MTGVIGLGAMGGNIASTLVRNLQDVMVYDIIPERCERLGMQGASIASGIPDLVGTCGNIILSLPSSEITTHMLEAELLPIIGSGKTVIDTGTTIIEETRRIAALFSDRGAFLLDAPVSGGNVGAADGSLYMFVGGNRDAFSEVRGLLGILAGSRLTYCGRSGSGQVVKAVNQLAMGIVDAAYLECIAFGVADGVDVSILRNAVGGSDGFREAFTEKTAKILDGHGEDFCCKIPEYRYFMDEVDRKGLSAPILRGLSKFVGGQEATGRDNMNRSYPPLWPLLLQKRDES